MFVRLTGCPLRCTWCDTDYAFYGGRECSIDEVLAQVQHFADEYDELSPLGREQARRLGEFWVRRRIDFGEVYCGPRARQRQTADVVGSVFTRPRCAMRGCARC